MSLQRREVGSGHRERAPLQSVIGFCKTQQYRLPHDDRKPPISDTRSICRTSRVLSGVLCLNRPGFMGTRLQLLRTGTVVTPWYLSSLRRGGTPTLGLGRTDFSDPRW